MNILKVTKKVKSNILNARSNLGIKSTDIKYENVIFFTLLLLFLRNNFKGSVMIFNI